MCEFLKISIFKDIWADFRLNLYFVLAHSFSRLPLLLDNVKFSKFGLC